MCLAWSLDLEIPLRLTVDFGGIISGLPGRGLSRFGSSRAELGLLSSSIRTGSFSGVQVADFIFGVSEEDPSECSDGLS